MDKEKADVMAIFERMTVYPITAWQIMTGLVFINREKWLLLHGINLSC